MAETSANFESVTDFGTDLIQPPVRESMAGTLSEAALQAALQEFELLFEQFAALHGDDEQLILAEVAAIAQNPQSALNALIMLL